MKRNWMLPMLALFAFCALPAIGQGQQTGNDAVRVQDDADPQEDPALAIQGEYVGAINGGGGDVTVGVQVIALGNDEFEIVGYHGGLPGEGWDGEEPDRFSGKLEGGILTFSDERFNAELVNGRIELTTPDGMILGGLEKAQRQSETLGKEPPEGAYVFFDGTSTDKFEPARNVQEVRMTEDGLLLQGVNSKHTYGDCHLHVEFRLSFMPKARGQQRSNSGVYLQGSYEVQVLDSFGLSGEHNECGGLYTVAKPSVNMCYPPMSWQTYDIDFRAPRFDEAGEVTERARITVRHNGVLIHDDVELPNPTTAAPNGKAAEKGFLHLQDHGNTVWYRNIWMVEK